MIKEWLNEYKPKNNQEAEQALREIIQEIALFGLQQSGFFEVAAFYGGTALRIFHGLPRFSEDLEFSLLSPVENFSLQPYINGMVEQLKALGIDVTVKEKIKTQQTNVDSAFLKTNTEWKELVLKDVIPQEKLGMRPEIKIKLEVDTYPPKAFVTEQKLLLKPASFYVSIFTLPDLFAGKMHALLFRKWKNRVKGRDWFDLEWYIRKNIPLHLEHLEIRSRDSGSWAGNKLTEKELMKMLHNRIDETSIDLVKKDVLPFVPDAKPPDIWSEKYFHDLVDKMRIE
jgi:predicted nucleotidyltransferase component of viral defense system